MPLYTRRGIKVRHMWALPGATHSNQRVNRRPKLSAVNPQLRASSCPQGRCDNVEACRAAPTAGQFHEVLKAASPIDLWNTNKYVCLYYKYNRSPSSRAQLGRISHAYVCYSNTEQSSVRSWTCTAVQLLSYDIVCASIFFGDKTATDIFVLAPLQAEPQNASFHTFDTSLPDLK